jgi:hypothetical protein
MTMKVTEGQIVKLKAGPSHAQRLQDFTILPSCKEDNGRWICVAHDKVLWNNFEKDSHLQEKGKHIMAWYCAHHGPEVP